MDSGCNQNIWEEPNLVLTGKPYFQWLLSPHSYKWQDFYRRKCLRQEKEHMLNVKGAGEKERSRCWAEPSPSHKEEPESCSIRNEARRYQGSWSATIPYCCSIPNETNGDKYIPSYFSQDSVTLLHAASLTSPVRMSSRAKADPGEKFSLHLGKETSCSISGRACAHSASCLFPNLPPLSHPSVMD